MKETHNLASYFLAKETYSISEQKRPTQQTPVRWGDFRNLAQGIGKVSKRRQREGLGGVYPQVTMPSR